jgi:multidrug efflux system outer membrane protein
MRAPTVLSAGVLLIAACAVGPTTRVATPEPRAVRPPDSAMAAPARSFLDSLAARRMADSADTAAGALWRPAALTLDSAGDVGWLAVLRDSTLVALVDTAIRNNRDLRAAVARVREFRAELGATRGSLFPQITANAAASTNQTIFGNFPPQKFDAVRITGDLAWELDFWGKLRRQTEAAKFDWQGREEDRRATVVSLVADVATAYLDLREFDQSVEIAQRTLESRRATLDLAQRRFAQGVISELDVRQFEAAAATAAASVADLAQRREETRHRLRLLLGQEPGPIPAGQPLAATVQAVQVPDSLPGELLLRRPDVQRAQRDWQAATARIGVAVGNRLPRFSVTAEYGTQRAGFDGLFGSQGEIYSLQGGVSIPLFTGGRLVNEQRAAVARAEQSRAHYEQTLLSALSEASDALAALRLSRDQLAAQQTQTEALRRAYTLAQLRYETGVASYLEVLDAQRTLFVAELALVQVERQYLAGTVQLYKALGGGW